MSIQNLRIYQDAAQISTEIVEAVRKWPTLDQQSLGMQIIRATDSICHNIAEGYGRSATGERLQFLFYADGSLQEAKNQILLAVDRGLISPEKAKAQTHHLRRLSISLIEFCHEILLKDPDYKGAYRKRVEQRRAWRFKKKVRP